MDSHRDIGIAAALGGGTGTILAMALGQHWLPGAIIGIMLGALIGGLSFRPLEVAHVVWRVLRERWRTLIFSTIVFAVLYGVAMLLIRWPRYSVGTVAALFALGALRLGWVHRTAVARAIVWFIGKTLAFAWVASAFAVGATVLPLATMWITGYHLTPFDSGILLSVISMVLLMLAWDVCGIWRIVQREDRPRWQWVLIGWFLRLIKLSSKPTPSDPNRPFIPTVWGSLQIDGQYVRWRELGRLSQKTGEIAFIGATVPLMVVGLAVVVVADVPITITLALASTARLAAMEGALIGSTMGFATVRLGASPLLAVALGAATAAACSIGLYRLRKALDTAPQAAPA